MEDYTANNSTKTKTIRFVQIAVKKDTYREIVRKEKLICLSYAGEYVTVEMKCPKKK